MRRELYLLYPEPVNYADTNKPLTQHFDSKLMSSHQQQKYTMIMKIHKC